MILRDLHAFIYDGTVLEYMVGEVSNKTGTGSATHQTESRDRKQVNWMFRMTSVVF